MIDRLLEPGSTHLPDCKCGHAMEVARVETKTEDIQIKTFRCPRCFEEMQLMIWAPEAVDAGI